MSLFWIIVLAAAYFFHAIVIQPWVTTLVLNATSWVEKKVTSLTASGTTVVKKV